MQVKKQQLERGMEQQTGSKLGKDYIKAYIVTCFLNLYAEYIMWNARFDEAQAEIKIAGKNINNLRYADWESHFLGRLIISLGVPKERGVWNSQGGRKGKLFPLYIP